MNSKLIATEDGVNLYAAYTDKPSDTSETILFLHGFPDTNLSWSKQVPFFSKDYQIITYDLRGAGKSSPPVEPSGYSMDYLMKDLNLVIEKIVGKDKKIHLVGHDWGAIIMWSLLSEKGREKNFLSFTAVSCPHPMIFFKNIIGKMFAMKPMKFMEGFQQLLRSYYILLFQLPFIPEFIWTNFTNELWKLLMSNSGLSETDPLRNLSKEEILKATVNSVNMYRQILRNGPPPLPRISLDIPVAMFIPEDDLALTPEVYDDTSSIARNIRTFRIQANHWVHRERPDWFNDNLQEFLASLPKQST
jgi:pimeloyl-ACP methyl ester carboxylesterase